MAADAKIGKFLLKAQAELRQDSGSEYNQMKREGKENMLKSLKFNLSDETFMQRNPKYPAPDALEAARDDIFGKFEEILDLIEYVNTKGLQEGDELTKEDVEEYCCDAFRELVDHLIAQHYIPPLKADGQSLAYWSSLMGRNRANVDTTEFAPDTVISNYLGRILMGWRPEDVAAVKDAGAAHNGQYMNVFFAHLNPNNPKKKHCSEFSNGLLGNY